MGRSVSYANYSQWVLYGHLDYEDEYDTWTFGETVESIQYCLKQAFPSLSECDKWLGREDHAILENAHVYIGISEYCGLVSVWCTLKADHDGYWHASPRNLAAQWAQQIKPKVEKALDWLCNLRKVGHMSNGEGVYERTGQ